SPNLTVSAIAPHTETTVGARTTSNDSTSLSRFIQSHKSPLAITTAIGLLGLGVAVGGVAVGMMRHQGPIINQLKDRINQLNDEIKRKDDQIITLQNDKIKTLAESGASCQC